MAHLERFDVNGHVAVWRPLLAETLNSTWRINLNTHSLNTVDLKRFNFKVEAEQRAALWAQWNLGTDSHIVSGLIFILNMKKDKWIRQRYYFNLSVFKCTTTSIHK